MPPLLKASFSKTLAPGISIRIADLTLGAPAVVTILFGASGCGKTTVLRCLAGLEKPDEGSICFGNETWFDAKQGQFLPPRLRKIGFVPQDYALFPHLTVAQNVQYGLKAWPSSEQASRTQELLDWLELGGLQNRLPGELSGGQKQRAALARALAAKPRLLLLDEPFSALDLPTRQRLRTDLRRLLPQLGIPIIVVTHDRLEAMILGDELVVMDNGQIIQTGSVPDVLNRPANLTAAAVLGMDTVQLGHITEISDGLAKVNVAGTLLVAMAGELPSGTTEVLVCIRAEDVVVAKHEMNQISSRNQLTGTIHSLTPEGALVRVEVDCGFPLKALLTKNAQNDLSLEKNTQVTVLIKVPQIHLIPHGTSRQTAKG